MRKLPSRGESSPGGRAGIQIWGPVAVLTLLGFVVAYQFVEPAPPSSIVLATGNEDGAYHKYGEAYAKALAEYDIEVVLQRSDGSVENVGMLESGLADAAFVQGGVIEPESVEGLEGIASLYYEPLWIFHRQGLEIERLTDLVGGRVEVGDEGSGTLAVASALLDANGIDAQNTSLLTRAPDEAVVALLAGEVDALFLVLSPDSEAIDSLMEVEGQAVHLFDVDRHLGYVRTFPYLAHAVLAEGVLDFENNVPAREVDLVAPTATLVARDDLHAALAPIFIRVAEGIHGAGDQFSSPGEFPSPEHLDVELAPSSRLYFENGPSFLYRVFPFQVAAAIDRLKILLLPLLTLLLPLLKLAPPIYQWRIRSKIYRWYKSLDEVERRFAGAQDSAAVQACAAELERIDHDIRETVNVPASYMEELYNLRMHLARLHEDVAEAYSDVPSPPAEVNVGQRS